MNHYTVRFQVGKDKQVFVRPLVTLNDPTDNAEIRRKIAAMGVDYPRQFPASAVNILSVIKRVEL